MGAFFVGSSRYGPLCLYYNKLYARPEDVFVTNRAQIRSSPLTTANFNRRGGGRSQTQLCYLAPCLRALFVPAATPFGPCIPLFSILRIAE